MKLKDATGVAGQLEEFLRGFPEPEPTAAQALKGFFGDLAEALVAEGRDKDAAKARKAAVHSGDVAGRCAEDPEAIWCWLAATASALAKVVEEGVAYEEAGYPEDLTAAASTNLADAEILSEFLSRQDETLAEVEAVVLDIESGNPPADAAPIMRIFHTLKGEAGLLDLEDLSRLAHATEDMLTSEPLTDCAERLLLSRDWIEQRIRHQSGDGPAPGNLDDVLDALVVRPEPTAREVGWADVGLDEGLFERNLLQGDVELLQEFIGESADHLDEAEAKLLVLESEPTEADALNAIFRAFHTIKGVAGFIEMTHVQELAHKAENLLDMARRGELTLGGDAMDLTFEAVDMLKKLGDDIVEALGGDGTLRRREELPGLLDRLIRRAEGECVEASGPRGAEAPAPQASEPPQAVEEPEPVAAAPAPAAETTGERKSGLIVLNPRKPKPETKPTQAKAVKKPAGKSAKKPCPQVKLATGAPVQRREAVRVDADRLDLLVETIGELVIAEAMVSQSGALRSSASVEVTRNLDHLDKICRELQEIGMSLRMVPVRPVFQKMARLVRDLSRKVGRRIEFEMSGEETELDKSVVDKIADPLVHMIRNAVDHGIESDPAERKAKGKPEVGHVKLYAYHKGGNIVIEVVDDGKGLDRDVILGKAVERGLVKEGQVLSDREVFNLIFEPGFSTAKKVTDVSGRGVGMDVVRRNIEELRGSVEIESTLGEGSIFRFKLPLTLAIIDGMVVRTGLENYIIPTLSVVRLIRPAKEDYATVREKGEMLCFEGGLVPLHRLNRVFDVHDGREELDETVVVVVESEGRRVGLVTDDLIGQQQIVIKSLGEKLQGTPGLAGGAIMSDGNVALILDVPGLVKIAHEEDPIVRD